MSNVFNNDIDEVWNFMSKYNAHNFDQILTLTKKFRIVIQNASSTNDLKKHGLGRFLLEIISIFVSKNYSITFICEDTIHYYNEDRPFDKDNIDKNYDLFIINHPYCIFKMNLNFGKIQIINIVHSEFFEDDYPLHNSKNTMRSYYPDYNSLNIKYLVVRSEIKNFIIKKFDLDPRKIQVILNPIDTKFLENDIIKNKQKYGVFAGTFSKIRENAALEFAKTCKEKNLKSIYIGNFSDSSVSLKENFDEVLLHNDEIYELIANATLCGGIQKGRTYWEAKVSHAETYEYNVDNLGNIIAVSNEKNDTIDEKLKKILHPETVAKLILFFAFQSNVTDFFDDTKFIGIGKNYKKLIFKDFNNLFEEKFNFFEEKINLSEVSLIINHDLKFDYKLLHKNIELLNKNFIVKIYIYCQLKTNDIDTLKNSFDNVEIIFKTQNLNEFQILDFLSNKVCSTNLLIYFDSNIFINPVSIKEGYEKIKNNQRLLYVLYNGFLIEIPHEKIENFEPYEYNPKVFWKHKFNFNKPNDYHLNKDVSNNFNRLIFLDKQIIKNIKKQKYIFDLYNNFLIKNNYSDEVDLEFSNKFAYRINCK